MTRALLGPAAVLALVAAAHAETDFLNRDGPVASGYLYPESDGGEPTDGAREKPPARTLIMGPTFRNTRSETEAGAGFGYVDEENGYLPYQLSVEPTWLRVKRVQRDRNFRKIRLGASAMAWSRTGAIGSTAVAVTGAFTNQENTSSTLELGGAITQLIGERLSVTANVDWGREYLRAGPTTDTAIAAFGTSYYVAPGVRFGGFYQLYNRIDAEDDWGMFISYAFLPFAELVVEGGKNQFVLAKVLVSHALEWP